MNMLKKRNQKGFTLIEIIAVLVILGILAAVAIPKFFDLQTESRQKAVDGALASVQSTLTQEYSKGLLNGTYTAILGPTANASFNVGDFTGAWTDGSGTGTYTVQITACPTGWSACPTNSKTVKLW